MRVSSREEKWLFLEEFLPGSLIFFGVILCLQFFLDFEVFFVGNAESSEIIADDKRG